MEQDLLAAIRRKISSASKANKPTQLDLDSNSVSSTQQPQFFQPLNPPGLANKKNKPDQPRKVQFFVSVPNGKPGRKIPGLSKIQDKLARLNAAISESIERESKQPQAIQKPKVIQKPLPPKTAKPKVLQLETSTSVSISRSIQKSSVTYQKPPPSTTTPYKS